MLDKAISLKHISQYEHANNREPNPGNQVPLRRVEYPRNRPHDWRSEEHNRQALA